MIDELLELLVENSNYTKEKNDIIMFRIFEREGDLVSKISWKVSKNNDEEDYGYKIKEEYLEDLDGLTIEDFENIVNRVNDLEGEEYFGKSTIFYNIESNDDGVNRTLSLIRDLEIKDIDADVSFFEELTSKILNSDKITKVKDFDKIKKIEFMTSEITIWVSTDKPYEWWSNKNNLEDYCKMVEEKGNISFEECMEKDSYLQHFHITKHGKDNEVIKFTEEYFEEKLNYFFSKNTLDNICIRKAVIKKETIEEFRGVYTERIETQLI